MITTSDFRMTTTDDTFKWFGETRPGLPLIRNWDGTIFLPYLFYFGYIDRRHAHRISHGSMLKQAYALREWLTYLTNRKRKWEDGDDLLFHEWREFQTHSMTGVSAEQIERKIAWVFAFYREISNAMPFDKNGEPTQDFVAPLDAAPGTAPLASKLLKYEGREIIAWAGSKPRKDHLPRKSVLTAEGVQRIKTAIRSPSSDTDLEDGIKKIWKRERDWLMASTMSGGGFRAVEVSRFPMSYFTESLEAEGLLDGISKEFGPFNCVSELAENPGAQEKLLQNLKRFEEHLQREYVFIRIRGKGDKLRDAPFTPDLVRDLLTAGVWGVRHQMISAWRASDPSYVPPDNVFISIKSKKAYRPGSISDIMQAAFEDAHVAGSGHDLRKFYATRMASLILEEYILRMNGQMSDATISTVYHQVADALGHAKVTTTVKHYVNEALIHWTGVRNAGRRANVVKIWETLMAQQKHMSDEKLMLAGTILKGLAAAPETSHYFKLLRDASNDKDLNPAGPLIVSKPRNHLTVVPNE